MNQSLVAIDPDTTLFGWAHFRNGRLLTTDVAMTPYLPDFPKDADYVCEMPEDRPTGRKINRNDIIRLALAAGRIIGTRPCKFVTPTQWKGQLPKDVHHKRVWEALNSEEFKVLRTALDNTSKSAHPEILDAVALGLTELGRL